MKRQSKCEKDGNATNYEIMSFDESISNENASMSKRVWKKYHTNHLQEIKLIAFWSRY